MMKMPPEDAVLLVGKLDGIEALNLEPEEVFVFTRVNGSSSLKEIGQILGYDVARVWRLLVRCVEAGIVIVPGGAGPVVKERPKGAATILDRLDQEDRDPVVSKIPRSRRSDILVRHQALAKQTHYELLGVKPSASTEEIKKRYFALTKEFHPDRLYSVEASEYKQKLAEIFQRINGAFEDLKDPIRRESYDRALAGPAAPKKGAAKSEDKKEPFRASNLIERLALSKKYYEMGRREEDAGNGFAASNFYQMAFQYDPDHEPTQRALTRTRPFVERKRAEEYYEKAHNALEVHDAELAAELFEKVLELNPKKKQCYQDLAMLYLKRKSTVSGAKRVVEQALKIFPGDAEFQQLQQDVKEAMAQVKAR